MLGGAGPPAASLTSRLILALLDTHGELTRPELARLSDLPRTTVSEHVRVLLRRGRIVEQQASLSGRRGRPAGTLALPRRSGVVLVHALAHGDRIADGPSTCAVVTLQGRVLGRRTLPAGGGRPADGVRALRELLGEVAPDVGEIRAAVLGVPLPLDLTQVGGTAAVSADAAVIPAMAGIVGARPHEVLADAFGVPALLGNDADLGALGEVHVTAGQVPADLVYVKCLHGIGAGLTSGGRLLAAGRLSAGEIAHLQVEDGVPCPCGAGGCSGARARNAYVLSDRLRVMGVPVSSLADVRAAVAAGDRATTAGLREVGASIGRGLASFAMVYRPSVVALETALAEAAGPVAEGVEEGLAQWAPSFAHQQVRVGLAEAGPDAELIGAAAAVLQAERVIDVR